MVDWDWNFATGCICSFFAYTKYRLHTRRVEIETIKDEFISTGADVTDDGKESKIKEQSKNRKNNENKSSKEKNKKDNGKNKVKRNKFDGIVGFVEIDSLGILLPIYETTTHRSLTDGVGIVETTDIPNGENNSVSVIAGHRGGYNGKDTFLKINELKDRDRVNIIMKDKTYTYEVYGNEIIEPTDWSKFTREEDKSKVILMTCHPYPTDRYRLLIYTRLVNVEYN